MSTNDQGRDSADGDLSYAVAVVRTDEGWKVSELDDSALDSVGEAVTAMRGLRAESASFGLLNIDDDYFIIVRPVPGSVKVLLSDATAAVTDDIAADVFDELDIDVPDIADEDLDDTAGWPEGDLAILADVGLSEEVLAVVCEDADLWASEQLQSIAEALGFEDELSDAVDGDGDDDDYED
ncbi:tRNA adenosine deaminase-associated protein [Corynebacterium sputi]|uniref:tRNA adenosine deaminase-associated protein n=1 Tax=Corynebacterium sputi TaxID=489915 RepID=UPI00040BF77A|nr:tRNA adenosine deaminase-associated protein [Corynebacterium sputi]